MFLFICFAGNLGDFEFKIQFEKAMENKVGDSYSQSPSQGEFMEKKKRSDPSTWVIQEVKIMPRIQNEYI